MSLGTDIFTTLSDDSGLSTLIGSRIYPTQRPARCTYPCITWIRIGGAPDVTHSGPLTGEPARVRFTAWASTTDAADDVVAALRAALPSLSVVADVVSIAAGMDADGDKHYQIVETTIWHEP